MEYVPDNYDLFEQQAQLDKLPVCCECDEPIQDEYCYEINGEYVCQECLEFNHRKDVDALCL